MESGPKYVNPAPIPFRMPYVTRVRRYEDLMAKNVSPTPMLIIKKLT